MVPDVQPNALWSALFSALPDVMMLVDREGAIVEINHMLPPLTREQVIASNVRLYVPPHSVPRVEKALHGAFEHRESTEYEVDYVGPDGTTGWFRVSVAPVVMDGQVVLASFIAQDITERRRLETRTRKLATIVERGAEAMIIITPDGHVDEWNMAAEAIFGYSAQEIIGQHISILIPPEHMHEIAMIRETIETGASRSIRTVRIAKDRRHVHVLLNVGPIFSDDGTLLATCGFLRDITEEYEETEALRESNVLLSEQRAEMEHMLSSMLEHLPDGVVVIRDGVFEYANPAFERMSSYSLEQLMGMSVTKLVEPDHQTITLGNLRRSQAGEPATLRSVVMVTRTGTRVAVEAVSEQIAFRGKTAVLTVVRDVTERAQLEEKLRRAQRLEAVGRVASGVAHEINNALFIISANLELSLAALKDDPDTQELIEAAIEGAERSSTVVRGLLDYSREEPDAAKQRCAAHAVLSRSLPSYRKLGGSEVSVQLSLQAESDFIALRDARLEQIVTNVVLNSASAMKGHGQVHIATSSPNSSEGTKRFVLEISDSGPGIDEDVKLRIFEPFFTTKPSGEGSGLGLAVVSSIVERSGGEVEVDSKIGIGTTFRFSWPVAEQQPESGTPKTEDGAPTAISSSAPRRSVLVVDDEAQIRSLMVRMLTVAGYDVSAVDSAEQALRTLDSTKNIELVLTDDRMDGMTGVELIGHLRTSHPHLATILLTGIAPAAEKVSADMRILHKPIARQALLDAVQNALAGK